MKYTKNHEWIRLEDAPAGQHIAAVGITDHAQDLLGELVYVELPALDETFAQGDSTGVVESTKTASDIYAPLDCKVLAVNEALEDEPNLVNSSPYDAGWLYKVQIDNMQQFSELLDTEQDSE